MTFKNGVKAIPAIFDTATTFKHEMSFEDFIHEIKNITYIGSNITRHTNKSIYISVSLYFETYYTMMSNICYELILWKKYISLSEQTQYRT